jgi:hypothetical protein
VTVREEIDQLSAEPAVGDLGYSADQRLVASAVLGLQLLADEIDKLKDALNGAVRPPHADDDEGDDLAAQVADLARQVKKLKKGVKKVSNK